MSSDVKIYDWTDLGMEEFDGPERVGLYVLASDYAALEAVNARLREALELMVTTHDEGGWPTATITIARAALAAQQEQPQ